MKDNTGSAAPDAGPAIYRTRITHLRRAPVHHYFEHRSYSWYVDIDRLPRLPRWLRPFARFEARDHFTAPADGRDSLRRRVDVFLAERGIDLRGGRVTALLQPRVLGCVFNPLSLYWCHDERGALRHVVAEVRTPAGGGHAYLLPPDDGQATMVRKRLRASPFNGTDGHYLVRAPRPDDTLDIRISLHRENQPAFVATMRGRRRPARVAGILRMQVVAPLAPVTDALEMRIQAAILWLRRVPVGTQAGTCSATQPLAVPASR